MCRVFRRRRHKRVAEGRAGRCAKVEPNGKDQVMSGPGWAMLVLAVEGLEDLPGFVMYRSRDERICRRDSNRCA